jgi:hypothetical protein
MTTSRTVHGDYLFKVSEYADGTPWISLEPQHSQDEFKSMLIGFDLAPKTDLRKAEAVARYLNDNLGRLAVTFFDGARIGP